MKHAQLTTVAGHNYRRQQMTCGEVDIAAFPVLMTESELLEFLRIPVVSNAADHHNVVENLKRLRNLPRIHICNKALYPKGAILRWIEQETMPGK